MLSNDRQEKIHGVKHKRFKPLISCCCWRGSCKHATPYLA